MEPRKTTSRAEAPEKAVRIHCVDPRSIPDWDRLVCEFPQHTPFHSCAWAEVLIDTYGHRPFYLVAEDDEGVRAIMPLMEVNSILTGRRGVSLPFSDVCPLLVSEKAVPFQAPLEQKPDAPSPVLADILSPDVGGEGRERGNVSQGFKLANTERPTSNIQRQAGDHLPPQDLPSTMFRAAQSLARSRRWKYLEVRDWPRTVPGDSVFSTFYTHTLDLQRSIDELFSGLHSSVRRAIRKSEKAGLEIEFSTDLKAVEEYYALHLLTRKRLGAPPQAFGFFCNIHRYFMRAEEGTHTDAGTRVEAEPTASHAAGRTPLPGLRQGYVGQAVSLSPSTGAREGQTPVEAKPANRRDESPSYPPARGLVILARHEGRAVAGAVYLTLGSQVLFKFGASRPDYHALRSNNRVMWAAIQWFASRGYKQLHFGRTSKRTDGLRHYKQRYGTQEQMCDYLRYSNALGQMTGEASEGVGAGLSRLIRWMPAPMVRAIGGLSYRHLS